MIVDVIKRFDWFQKDVNLRIYLCFLGKKTEMGNKTGVYYNSYHDKRLSKQMKILEMDRVQEMCEIIWTKTQSGLGHWGILANER